MNKEELAHKLRWIKICGECMARSTEEFLRTRDVEDLKNSNSWARWADEEMEEILTYFDSIENGMVRDDQEAYEQIQVRAEQRAKMIADERDEIMRTIDIGDILEAIAEAPTNLHEYMFRCHKNGDFCDLGASISDMVGYYADRLAERRVDKRTGD